MDLVVEKHELSFPRVIVHAQHAQQRGLPCARRPHDRHELALRDIQIDLPQHIGETSFRLEALFDVSELYHSSRLSLVFGTAAHFIPKRFVCTIHSHQITFDTCFFTIGRFVTHDFVRAFINQSSKSEPCAKRRNNAKRLNRPAKAAQNRPPHARVVSIAERPFPTIGTTNKPIHRSVMSRYCDVPSAILENRENLSPDISRPTGTAHVL